MTTALKIISILIAAVIIGNWFLSEVKRARISAAPWYAPYCSPPGILIIIAMLIPILMRIMND